MSRESHAYYSSQSGEEGRERKGAFLNVQGRHGAVCQNHASDGVAENLGTETTSCTHKSHCNRMYLLPLEKREVQTVGDRWTDARRAIGENGGGGRARADGQFPVMCFRRFEMPAGAK